MYYLVRPSIPEEARQSVIKAEGETEAPEKNSKSNTKKD